MIRNIVRFIVILGLCCLVMGGGVAVLYGWLRGDLDRREKAAKEEAVMAVCPPGATVDMAKPLAGEPFAPDAVYVATAGGKPAAFIAGGEETGYASRVRIVVGATKEGDALRIYKVAVLAQAETPGLGATIAETRSTYPLWKKLFGAAEPETVFTPFISDFAGKSPDQVQEIHAITAATITSDAVKAAIGQALDRIREATR